MVGAMTTMQLATRVSTRLHVAPRHQYLVVILRKSRPLVLLGVVARPVGQVRNKLFMFRGVSACLHWRQEKCCERCKSKMQKHLVKPGIPDMKVAEE